MGQVPLRWNYDAALALQRLYEKADCVIVYRRFERSGIAVAHDAETRREWTEPVTVLRVVGEAHDRRGAAVKVTVANHDLRAVRRYAFHLIPPLAHHLDRGFHCFRARVHRQRPLIAEQRAQLAQERTHYV